MKLVPCEHEDILVIDDFLDNPLSVREHARLSEFYNWQGPDGQIYKRVSICKVPGVQAKLFEIFGPYEMLGQAYRLNYSNECPNQSIHSDMGWGTHALVLYLCEGPGGTAFWQHRETGERRITSNDVELYEKIKDDWEDASKWNYYYLADLKFNRAVIYSSELFHSRYPFEAFGEHAGNGRLIAVAFFTPQSEESESDSSSEAI